MLRVNTKLSVNDMALYLRYHGWQELPKNNPRVTVFQGENDDFGRPLLLMILSNDQCRDAALRLAEALELLAALGDCSIALLAPLAIEDMLTQIQDFLHREAVFLNQAPLSI
jgi:hypothetical protein